MNEVLYPISELIELAKKRGIFLGRGTPQNRIAYFVKLGLIPHAIRKTNPKTGKIEAHFPVSILESIEEINYLKRKNGLGLGVAASIDNRPTADDTGPLRQSSRLAAARLASEASSQNEKRFPNLKFLVAGFAVVLIMLLYTNFILGLANPQSSKVLGVSDFIVPVAEQVSPLFSPITRFFSNIGNSVRLAVGTALLSLIPQGSFTVQTKEKVVTVSSETLPSNLTLSSLDVSGNSTLSTATIGTLAVTNNQTIGGTLIVTGDTTLKNDLKVDKNITLTGVINSTRITDNKLVFGGDSPSIYAGTTNTGISLNANGTGAISIGNSSKGDIYIGGGDTSGTRCFVTNASGNLTCSGDITVNGGDILTGGSTLRIGTSSTTVNIAGTLAVGSSTTTITGSSVTTGQISLTRVPTSAHTGTWAIGSSTWNVSDSSFYINPASAGADTNLFGVAINGSVRFAVDAEGDTFANNLVVAGSTTTAATTIAGTLSIEGNTTIGDSTTDTLTINPATITLTGGDKTIDITGAATRTISILNSTAGQVANLSVEGTLVSSNISSGATVSGANTGDQTITLTGDVTGSGTGSFATTLANTAVTAGSYGGATAVPVLTIDAKGRITAASTASISSAWSSITNPTTNLSLSMAANTSTFTYNAATGASTNLFNLTDTTNNTGTGYLMNITTAAGSTLKPFHVQTTGSVDAITVLANGTTGIGTTSTSSQLQVNTQSTTTIGEIIKAQASQTADLLQIRSSVDAILAKIDSAGNLTANTLTSTVATGTSPLTVTSTTLVNNLHVAAADQPQPNLVLNSDFGRRNKWMTFMPETFADTSGWTLVSGTSIGTVASNILTFGSSGGTLQYIRAGLSTWRDGRFSCQGKIVETSGTQMFCGKFVDANNYVTVELVDNGTLRLTKNIAGVSTVVTAVAQAVTLNNWYWFELEAQGTTYIVKLYNSGTSPVAKSSATLLQTISGTVSDSAVTSGYIFLGANTSAAMQWGGLSTGDGGVYVEGWGPESWTPVFGGTKGGQAIGFDESADSGPLGYQWAMRAYIPATSRDVHLNSGADSTDTNTKTIFVKPSTTYTFSTYEKSSGLGGSGQMILLRAHAQTSALGGVTNAQVADSAETSWTRISNTIATSSTNVYGNMDIYINPAATRTGTAFFLLPQWEEGGIATPWRNAPADDDPIVWKVAARTGTSPNSLTTTSASFVEIEPRDFAINAFLPWDGTLTVEPSLLWQNDGLGNGTWLDIRVDGTSLAPGDRVAYFKQAVASYTTSFSTSVASNQSAGKHRANLLWKVDAGTSSLVYAQYMNVTATRGKFDLAEEYSVTDTTIEAGDVVRLAQQVTSNNQQTTDHFNNIYHYSDSATIERANKGYDGAVLGIVSTAPGITLGNFNLNAGGTISSELNYDQRYSRTNLRPVALSGRVPVKVTNENGEINRGDFLTSSALYPGFAMRATHAGRVIGIAMDDFHPNTSECLNSNAFESSNSNRLVCTGKVLTFVNLSWYDPDAYLTDSGQFVINKVSEQPAAALAASQNGQVEVQTATSSATTANNTQLYNRLMHYTLQNNSTKETIERTGAFNNLFVANLKVGKLDASEITQLTALEQRIRRLELSTSSAVLSASVSALLTSNNSLLTTNASGSAVSSQGLVVDSLSVLKKTILNDLGITGKISAGLLSIDGLNSSISSLSDIKLKVPGGGITIDKEGNLIVSNKITAQKIEADIFSSTKASGSSILPANTASIDVISENATESAKILITPTVLTDRVLTVTQKGIGKFTVSVKVIDSQDIRFDWFIVN